MKCVQIIQKYVEGISFIHSFIHFIQTSKILVTSTNLHRQKMILINWSSITAIT